MYLLSETTFTHAWKETELNTKQVDQQPEKKSIHSLRHYIPVLGFSCINTSITTNNHLLD